MSAKYEITIATGRRSGAGTDATIHVTLIGRKGESGPHKLDKALHNDFERGRTDTYRVDAPDLGELLALRFTASSALTGEGNNWLLDRADVVFGVHRWSFPNYTWLRGGNEITLLSGKTSLAGGDDDAHAALRETQLEARRLRYPWAPNDGSLPGSFDISNGPPIDEKYRDITAGSYSVAYVAAAAKMAGAPIKRVWEALEDVAQLFFGLPTPSVVPRWREDAEFARQAVQGIAPVHLRLCQSLPEGMPLDDDAVYGLLEAGLSLQDALSSRRVFLLDFAPLEGIPMFPGPDPEKTAASGMKDLSPRYAPPARALLFLDNAGALRPLAIQLGRDPEVDLVWTPNDDPHDWLAAKMYLRCAEGNLHQPVSHALDTHFAMEPFVMSTLRNLPAPHPVYKIMKRHTRYTIAINDGARDVLLKPGGQFDGFIATGGGGHVALLKQEYQKWTLRSNNPRRRLADRGVLDPAVLPYYPYRDDALAIFDAIEEYVRATLAIFYPDDASLVADGEMMAWWADIVENGLRPGAVPWTSLERVEDLVEVLSTVIFSVSALHAAVNYQQYEHYAFTPNAPLCMRQPPPTARGTLDDAALLEMLPSKKMAMSQAAIGAALTTFGVDEEYLLRDGGWRERYFDEPEAVAAMGQFEERMEALEAAIEERNSQEGAVPYEQLLPSKVPTSITI